MGAGGEGTEKLVLLGERKESVQAEKNPRDVLYNKVSPPNPSELDT